MPRPKKESGIEPKKRSRTGCWPCKARKVKCGEEKPACANCVKNGEACDYSIRLNWGGRARKDNNDEDALSRPDAFTFVATPTSVSQARAAGSSSGHEHVFSSQHIATAPIASLHRQHTRTQTLSRTPSFPPTPEPTPGDNIGTQLDPRLGVAQQQRDRIQEDDRQMSTSEHVQEDRKHMPETLRYDTHQQYQQHRFTAPSIGSGTTSPGASGRSPPTSAPNDFSWSPQHRAKRARLSPGRSPVVGQAGAVFIVPQYPVGFEQSPGSSHFSPPHSIGGLINTPATPGSSSNSGSPYPTSSTLHIQDPPDLRRLSVRSLLSDPSEETERPRYARTESLGHRTYGYDHGLPDLDAPRNDDQGAIGPRSPDLRRASAAVSDVSSSSGEETNRQMAFEPGGYYAHPVPVKISKVLEPLPRELTDNPINLLYFHHFINHTGRIMVPHDCAENPFRGVLPQMAVRNIQLLHLLLAFSASHRARLLNHPEPANRIAGWMSDVLPALRQALDGPSSPSATEPTDPTDPSSLAPLATAIMLASLEIISPNTFAVAIPWEDHLQMARRMIVAKGGLHHLAQKADGARDKAIFFISRWFAYLDVLGSLSGGKHGRPMFGAYLEDGGGLWLVNRNDEEIYQIDCLFGFSGRCIALLAAVAELAGECDKERIDPMTRQPRPGWLPSEAVRRQAEELKQRIKASARCVYRGCMHGDPDSPSDVPGQSERDFEEVYATNEAYHWAGLIHLSRRVLNLPHTDPEVQDAVRRVIRSLSNIQRGSTADGCLLFPMFTAGCEALETEERRMFIDRLTTVERWGMQHVRSAKEIMRKVWETGEAWEGMVHGEFFG